MTTQDWSWAGGSEPEATGQRATLVLAASACGSARCPLRSSLRDLASGRPDVPERNLLDVSVGKAKTLLKIKRRVCWKGDELLESRGPGPGSLSVDSSCGCVGLVFCIANSMFAC